MMSATVFDATIVGRRVQKLAKVSVSNVTSTLGTFCMASLASDSQNARSSSVPVQKNQRKATFWPPLAGAVCAAAVGAAAPPAAAGGAVGAGACAVGAHAATR